MSVGFDSLGELGMGAIGEVLVELELELVPVPLVVLLLVPVSAFGASAGAGVGAGAATGGVGAGAGGGVTTFSSFLQAMRPTARMAARRSERFIFFPLGGVTRLTQISNDRFTARAAMAYPIVIRILAAPAWSA